MYSFLKAFLVLMKLLSLSEFYAPKIQVNNAFLRFDVVRSVKDYLMTNLV